MAFLLLLLASCAPALTAARVNVVLVGATGNLAKKYLFQAFFDQILMDDSIYLIPAATKKPQQGQQIIDATIAGNVTCHSDTTEFGDCSEQKGKFRANTFLYTQLRSEDHWMQLAEELQTDMNNQGVEETGRLIYLSVPPKFFAAIAAHINAHMRPARESAWLRVVFEKPFGKDEESAKKLAADLSNQLLEKEILRVDHYLGKAGVTAITDFRAANPDIDGVLNNKHVAFVEIAMHETEDCAGRTGFFDSYGTIRDVMQNHLTEMATLAAMDVYASSGHSLIDQDVFSTAKSNTLQTMLPPHFDSTYIGQYTKYDEHVAEDLAAWKTPAEMTERQGSVTPTFAWTQTYFENERWRGVPFVLSAGKMLPERKAFVRYFFDNKESVEVQIQGPGKFNTMITSTLESGHLPLHALEGWVKDRDHEAGVYVVGLEQQKNAYWVVVDRALKGDSTMFVDTNNLMASWKAWTPLLHDLEGQSPVMYGEGERVTPTELVDVHHMMAHVPRMHSDGTEL